LCKKKKEKDTLTRAIVARYLANVKMRPRFYPKWVLTPCPGTRAKNSLHNFVNYTVPKKREKA